MHTVTIVILKFLKVYQELRLILDKQIAITIQRIIDFKAGYNLMTLILHCRKMFQPQTHLIHYSMTILLHIKPTGCGKFHVIHYKHVTNGCDSKDITMN